MPNEGMLTRGAGYKDPFADPKFVPGHSNGGDVVVKTPIGQKICCWLFCCPCAAAALCLTLCAPKPGSGGPYAPDAERMDRGEVEGESIEGTPGLELPASTSEESK